MSEASLFSSQIPAASPSAKSEPIRANPGGLQAFKPYQPKKYWIEDGRNGARVYHDRGEADHWAKLLSKSNRREWKVREA